MLFNFNFFCFWPVCMVISLKLRKENLNLQDKIKPKHIHHKLVLFCNKELHSLNCGMTVSEGVNAGKIQACWDLNCDQLASKPTGS